MNTATVERRSAKQAQVTCKDSGVQHEFEPNAYSIDAVVESESTVGTVKNDSLQIIQESSFDTSTQDKIPPRHRLFFKVIKLFAVLRIPGLGYWGQPIKLQHNKGIDNNDSLHSENVDKLKAQKRNVQLQQI